VRRKSNHDNIKEKWRQIIKEKAPYGKNGTQLISYPKEEEYTAEKPPELDFNKLYVYCDFISPGRHSYMVSYESVMQAPMTEPEPEQMLTSHRSNKATFMTKPEE